MLHKMKYGASAWDCDSSFFILGFNCAAKNYNNSTEAKKTTRHTEIGVCMFMQLEVSLPQWASAV